MQMYDSQTLTRISELRQREAAGLLTLDDMREAVRLIRQGRIAAQSASTASRSRTAAAKAPAKSADDLLSELDM